jgi:hypothetical protein
MNWKTVIVLTFVILISTVGAGIVRDSRIDTDFPAIRAKSSEADVRQLMGDPKQVQHSCTVYDTTVTPDCDHVFIYRSAFYPARSKYWLVFFNENKQVTATSSQLEP